MPPSGRPTRSNSRASSRRNAGLGRYGVSAYTSTATASDEMTLPHTRLIGPCPDAASAMLTALETIRPTKSISARRFWRNARPNIATGIVVKPSITTQTANQRRSAVASGAPSASLTYGASVKMSA